jgi:hypothetical protein
MKLNQQLKQILIFLLFRLLLLNYPTSTRRHGNFAGVHTLLRILLSSNSAVLINYCFIINKNVKITYFQLRSSI